MLRSVFTHGRPWLVRADRGGAFPSQTPKPPVVSSHAGGFLFWFWQEQSASYLHAMAGEGKGTAVTEGSRPIVSQRRVTALDMPGRPEINVEILRLGSRRPGVANAVSRRA